MTMWEFAHLQSGFAKFNNGGSDEAKAPSKAEYEAALERFGVT